MSEATVGQIVHYKSYGTPGGEFEPECRAAIVTSQTRSERTGLAVLNPTGLFFNDVAYDEAQGGGTWHWPCPKKP